MTVIKTSLGAAIAAALCFAAPAHAGDQRAVADFKSCAKPQYPAASLAARHEGAVTLAFLVDERGSVLDSKIDISSGFMPLDKAAQQAIMLCKFRPAMKDGKYVQDWVNVQYVWTLK